MTSSKRSKYKRHLRKVNNKNKDSLKKIESWNRGALIEENHNNQYYSREFTIRLADRLKEYLMVIRSEKTTNEEYRKSVLYRFMDKAKKLVLLADPSCTQLENYKFVKSILEDYWDGKL